VTRLFLVPTQKGNATFAALVDEFTSRLPESFVPLPFDKEKGMEGLGYGTGGGLRERLTEPLTPVPGEVVNPETRNFHPLRVFLGPKRPFPHMLYCLTPCICWQFEIMPREDVRRMDPTIMNYLDEVRLTAYQIHGF
jgi:hypothetical protein